MRCNLAVCAAMSIVWILDFPGLKFLHISQATGSDNSGNIPPLLLSGRKGTNNNRNQTQTLKMMLIFTL